MNADIQEITVQLFESYDSIAFILSILLNVLISIAGVLPSVFLTAANLVVFGFWEGMVISFIGESVGAVVSFWLYRKGFRKLTAHKRLSSPKIQQLLHARGKEAFLLILSLRLLPFVPSGLVTFIAAIGKTSLGIFILASSIGKLPSILIEGYSVYQVMNWTSTGKVLVSFIGCVLIILVVRKLYTRSAI
nr:VTT domain-containing protein [Priestia flexa]